MSKSRHYSERYNVSDSVFVSKDGSFHLGWAEVSNATGKRWCKRVTARARRRADKKVIENNLGD